MTEPWTADITPRTAARMATWHRAHGRPEKAEVFESELDAAGRCRRCGRDLQDPESVNRGYGPDCWILVRREDAASRQLPLGPARPGPKTVVTGRDGPL